MFYELAARATVEDRRHYKAMCNAAFEEEMRLDREDQHHAEWLRMKEEEAYDYLKRSLFAIVNTEDVLADQVSTTWCGDDLFPLAGGHRP